MSVQIEVVLRPAARDIGGFEVRRSLPSAERRSVGPFVFFDEMGPAEFPPVTGLDVRPHPHIGLATVTYLFEGEILHRDNLGTVQAIAPGDVNWMTAGRGIVHSERTDPDRRRSGHRLHGIQAWLALPREAEATAPSFVHHPSSSLPSIGRDGARLRIIAGEAYGERAPVEVLSPTLYLDVRLDGGASLVLPAEHAQRAVYLVDGAVELAGEAIAPGTMAVLATGADVELAAVVASRAMVLGGAALDGPRRLEWNFVASDPELIDRAKADWIASIEGGWRGTRFTLPPGEHEHIPLPDRTAGPPPSTRDCPTT